MDGFQAVGRKEPGALHPLAGRLPQQGDEAAPAGDGRAHSPEHEAREVARMFE